MDGTRRTDACRDRGQLLLVAALVIGITLLALVVVWNGVLFTNTFAATETKQSGMTAEVMEHEVRTGTPAAFAHASDPGHDRASFIAAVDSEIDDYEDGYVDTQSHARSSTASLTYERHEMGDGMILRQDLEDDRQFLNRSGETDWTMLNSTQHGFDFAKFNVTFDLEESGASPAVPGENFAFQVETPGWVGTGEDDWYEVVYDDIDDNLLIYRYEELPVADGEEDVCTISDPEDEVWVDFLSGMTSEGPCEAANVTKSERGTFGYGLRINNGDEMVGEYQIWTSNHNPTDVVAVPESEVVPFHEGSGSNADPYIQWIKWEGSVEITTIEESVVHTQTVQWDLQEPPYEVDE